MAGARARNALGSGIYAGGHEIALPTPQHYTNIRTARCPNPFIAAAKD